MINALTQLSQQYDQQMGVFFSGDRDYFDILGKVEQTKTIRRYLTEVALKLHEAMVEERTNTTRNVIREAKQYIQENYQMCIRDRLKDVSRLACFFQA